MTTIVEFLTARYDEIEAAARAAERSSNPVWTHATNTNIEFGERFKGLALLLDERDGEHHTSRQYEVTNHIALHDPAYVLADIAAKRKILALHEEKSHRECRLCEPHDPEWPCRTVRLFAAPFDQHPDYDES